MIVVYSSKSVSKWLNLVGIGYQLKEDLFYHFNLLFSIIYKC